MACFIFSKNKDDQLVPENQGNHCKLLLLEISAVVSHWLSNRPSERVLKVNWLPLSSNVKNISPTLSEDRI